MKVPRPFFVGLPSWRFLFPPTHTSGENHDERGWNKKLMIIPAYGAASVNLARPIEWDI
jgi:hypothetical protein